MALALPLNELNHTTHLQGVNKRPRGIKKMVTEHLRLKISERIVEKVSANLDNMIDAQIESATGQSMLGDKQLPPNPNSFKALMEYTVSKAPEKKDIRVAVGITHLITSLENGDGDNNEDD